MARLYNHAMARLCNHAMARLYNHASLQPCVSTYDSRGIREGLPFLGSPDMDKI